jgi:hypothetical protein
MVRCRPGIVTYTEFATVPDQRCTAPLCCALHPHPGQHLITVAVVKPLPLRLLDRPPVPVIGPDPLADDDNLE